MKSRYIARHSRSNLIAFAVSFCLGFTAIAHGDGWASTTTWPNEPSGATVLLDWPFGQCAGSGIVDAYNSCSIVSDSTTTTTGTASPTSVAQAAWPAGTPSGGVQMDYKISPTVSEFYAGIWVNFGYPGSTNNYNKILYFKNNANAVFLHYGPSGGTHTLLLSLQGLYSSTGGGNNCHIPQTWGDPGVCQNLPGNVSAGVVTYPNIWHRLEFHVKKSTTSSSQDGIVQTWIDGQMVHNYSNVNWGPDPFYLIEWTQAWDGNQDANHPTNWYVWMDHLHISIPSGSTSASAPPAPTGLTVN